MTMRAKMIRASIAAEMLPSAVPDRVSNDLHVA
jgi:hypothetical protein